MYLLYRLRNFLNQLVDLYPISEIPQPVIRDTFGCSIYPSLNTQSALTFSPSVGDEIQLSADNVPSFSIALPGSLTDAIDATQSPAALFCAFRDEGLFVRRESYLSQTGRDTLVLSSNVACARVTLGVTVSTLTDPVTIIFTKPDDVRILHRIYSDVWVLPPT